MKRVIKYQAEDGSLHDTVDAAAKTDFKNYLRRVIGNISIVNDITDEVYNDLASFKKIVDCL